MINDKHRQEWQNSGIADDLIEANLVSLEGQNALDEFLNNCGHLPRTNTGRVASWVLRNYGHLWGGGWYSHSYGMGIVQFKPDFPRDDIHKIGKKIKYESPIYTESRIYLPYVPLERWKEIALQYSCETVKVKINGKKRRKRVKVWEYYSNFWEWVINHPEIPIIITEGVKKCLALLSQNFIAVALPGITMGVRTLDNGKKVIQRDLLGFCSAGREFTICFDKDIKPKTIKAVTKAIFSLGSQLQAQKCKVKVMSWDANLGKGIDDVIVNHGYEVLNNIYNSRDSFSFWAVKWQWKLRKPNLRVNARWFSEAVKDLPPHERLIAIKSLQNTGKTEVIARLIQERLRQGLACLVVVHLESLAKALSKRFGVPYRTEKDPTKGYYGFSLCIDSFHPKPNGVNPNDWDEVCLIFDEAEQVLNHGFLGNTAVDDFRPSIFKTLSQMKDKISQCIIADADLTNVSIDFFEKLLDCQAYIIENDFKFEGMNFYHYQSCNELLGYTSSCLDVQKRLFITTTSQKPKSKYGTIALEKFITERSPDSKVIRIDSETLNNPEHPAYKCLDDLNELLINYDVVICSPSISTGVSIDIHGHFDEVVGFSNGNVTPEVFLQMLWRLRDLKADRHFWCSKTGVGYIGNSSCSPNDVLESNNKIAKFNLNQLGLLDAELSLDDSEPIFLETWAKIAARKNASNRCWQELFLYLVKQQGHNLQAVTSNSVDKEDVKNNAKQCQNERNEQILDSKNIDSLEAEKLENKKKKEGHTLDDICTLKKYKMQKRYGDVTMDILEFDDDGKFKPLKLFYYLTLGRLFTNKKDSKVVTEMRENNQNSVCSFDMNKKVFTPKVKALEAIKILELLEYLADKRTVRNDDEYLNEINKLLNIKNNAKEFKAVGINVSKNTISTINAILRQVGFNLKCLGIIRDGKDTFREYYLETLPHFTLEILTHWLLSDKRYNPEIEVDSGVTDFVYITIRKLLRREDVTENPPNNHQEGERCDVDCESEDFWQQEVSENVW
jgi:hypothetical protein